jgi:transcriptional regulator with XRE-family HTH domain
MQKEEEKKEKKPPSKLALQFGELVRKKRTELEMSQEAFAEICGLHRTYIGSIELGKKTVTIDTANKVAQAFGITLEQYFQEINMADDKPAD